MRVRRALALAPLWLAAAGPAPGQTNPGRLPEGPGTLRGRIVHEGGGAVAGLPVVLYAQPRDGAPGLGHTRSDAEGGFAFAGISNDPELEYLVGVRAEELPFGARAAFAPGETLLEVELRVAAPIEDASGVEATAARLRIERGCGGLRVAEAHELRNRGPRVVFLPASRRERARPLLEVELPQGAGPLSVGFGSPALARQGTRVAFWGPLHPGVHEVEFAYSLAGSGAAALVWGLPQGARRVEVLTDAEGPTAAGPGLRPAPSVALHGRRYAAQVGGPFEPGARLELRVELPPAAPSPVQVDQAQLWLELDDAALVVDEHYRLALPGGQPLAAASGAPLLCLPLPPDAEALRFSSATLAMGPEADPSGALALRGPIPAGESAVALRYRIPVRGDTVELAPRFDRGVALLTVFIADTGVAAETARLHRRRPLRADDRTYLHLEGFQIEPGESVAIRLERLAPRRPAPRLALAGFALALTGAGIAFLVVPLRGRRAEPALDPELASLEAERESVVAALRGLEEDFETGKLHAPDYEQLRADLRARAAELIQRRSQARELAPGSADRAGPPGSGAGSAPAASPARCPACASKLPEDARFCHRCGRAVPAAGGPGAPRAAPGGGGEGPGGASEGPGGASEGPG